MKFEFIRERHKIAAPFRGTFPMADFFFLLLNGMTSAPVGCLLNLSFSNILISDLFIYYLRDIFFLSDISFLLFFLVLVME